MPASRALRFLAFALGASLSSAALAASPALVVDVDSGKVLHAERATDPWYPASVTKLMTAYVALQMVRDGTAAMDQLVTLSPEAAAQPPSKMGFRAGTQLTLENALKIIMVKSANDISVAIAEELGGSVEGFAAHMNEASRRLGMQDSRWVNPHGLPDDRQQTSARDMAVLGRALLREFPEHAGLFRIGAIQFGRRVMANHNGLIGRYPGIDGMKTGFICASGFNVVASATRGGRRLITVVMGSPSAAERTLRAADLFERGFNTLGWGAQDVDRLPPSAHLSPPNMRPVICERRGPMPAEEDAQPASLPFQASVGGNADNPTGLFAPPSALAFSGGSVPAGPRQLPPREKLQPVLVWIGATPPGTAKPTLEALEGGVPAKVAARPARAKAKRSVVAEPETTLAAAPAIIDAGEAAGSKGAIKPKAASKPREVADAPKPGAVGSGAAQRPKAGAIAAKPKVQAALSNAGEAAKADDGQASAKKPAKKAEPKRAEAKTAEIKKPEAKKAEAKGAAAKKPAARKAAAKDAD